MKSVGAQIAIIVTKMLASEHAPSDSSIRLSANTNLACKMRVSLGRFQHSSTADPPILLSSNRSEWLSHQNLPRIASDYGELVGRWIDIFAPAKILQPLVFACEEFYHMIWDVSTAGECDIRTDSIHVVLLFISHSCQNFFSYQTPSNQELFCIPSVTNPAYLHTF